jgi:hypothetical protein
MTGGTSPSSDSVGDTGSASPPPKLHVFTAGADKRAGMIEDDFVVPRRSDEEADEAPSSSLPARSILRVITAPDNGAQGVDQRMSARRGCVIVAIVVAGCSDRSHSASDSVAARPSASVPGATATQPRPVTPDTETTSAPGPWPVPPDSIGRLRGDTLELRLTNGKYAQLINVGPSGDAHLTYTYSDVLQGGAYYIVDVHYYESGGVVLVDRATGDQITMVDRPVVSPSESFGVATAYSLDIAEGANEIQIWQLLPHPATLAWSMTTPGSFTAHPWGASVDKWIGDSIILMTRHIRLEGKQDSLGNGPERRVPMRVVRRATGWELDTLLEIGAGSGGKQNGDGPNWSATPASQRFARKKASMSFDG